jgi:NADH:ubiquinone oxidoreductase subunit 6 (subunit J)
MSTVVFFVAAIGVLAGAIGVVTIHNPFYNVLALVTHLISLAALFLLLRAEFVAAAQVVVYAGAVMVLYVFVVAYVGGQDEPMRTNGPGLKLFGVLFGGALLVELWIAVLGSSLSALHHKGAPYTPGFGSPAQIGQLLLTQFLWPFELASFLLLVSAVAAVILARRRRGLDEVDPEGGPPPISVAEVLYGHAPLGSMKEGVGVGYDHVEGAGRRTRGGW